MSTMMSPDRYECPCCGYPTLLEQTVDAVCVLCDWAYGQGKSEPSEEEYTLDEARHNFQSHLTFRRPNDLPSFALETHAEVMAAKQNAILALERWRTEPILDRREVHWSTVESALRQLQSTRSLEDAFSWTDDHNVVIALIGLIEEKCQAGDGEPAAMPLVQKAVLNVHAFDAEVNNGGFHQLFINSTGDNLSEILAALREIGAIETAHLLERALAVYPASPLPASADEWYSFLKKTEPSTLKALAELDEAYFAQAEDLNALAAQYCRKHKSAFRNYYLG